MERPAKRQRLVAPLDSVFNQTFEEYYEGPAHEGEHYEGQEDDDEPENDVELTQKRAQLEYKLKCTFESIFEKYERDFDSVGDEVDLCTGEILVDNGHLRKMRDERDAGVLSESSHVSEDDVTGSDEVDDIEEIEDTEEEEEEEEEEAGDEDELEDEDALSDEDMVEDDLILRGFAQASQIMHRQPSDAPELSHDRFHERREPRQAAYTPQSLPRSLLPSRSEIISQFGPQLGPEVFKYVSDRTAIDDSSLEPAWRVPAVPPVERARRPVAKSTKLQPVVERSPSPENARSIWAAASGTTPRSRIKFSADDDELLVDFVSKARRRGLNLASYSTWKQLEAMSPRHPAASWKLHYIRKFTYLSSGQLDESDLSTSEASTSTGQTTDQINSNLGFRLSFTNNPTPLRTSRLVDLRRPTRVRRPTQRDGILSWTDAVPTIASVDPVEHAGLLEDAQRTMGYSLHISHPLSRIQNRSHLQERAAPKQHVNPYLGTSNLPAQPPLLSNSLCRGTEEELAVNGMALHNERTSTKEAPCPHVDCRLHPSTLYSVERQNHEQLSQMCKHLLTRHSIAPYPCTELNCERKGTRGYFMQNDLVRHVKEVHPYPTALYRLQGRVDSGLLGQSLDPGPAIERREVPGRTILGNPNIDSDFMSSRTAYCNHVDLTGEGLPLGSDQYSDRMSPPRTAAVPDDASSMYVHRSSAAIQDRSPECSYHSDPEILYGSPFVNEPTLETEMHRPLVEPAGRDERLSSPDKVPTQSMSYRNDKAQCPQPGCDRSISTLHPQYMKQHLQAHEAQELKTLRAVNNLPPTRNLPQPAIIPNSQSSAVDVSSSATLPASTNNQIPRPPHISQPAAPLVQGVVDRSYEFSDEEDGIQPTFQRPLPPTPLPDKAPSPVANKSLTTPSTKTKPTKSNLVNVFTSEDIDELSMGGEDFLLISSRPRSDIQSKSTLPFLVKSEETTSPNGLAASTKKRKIRSLEVDDEIDELGEDGPSVSGISPLGPIPGSVARIKKEVEESADPFMGSTNSIKPTFKKRLSHGVKGSLRPSSSLQMELPSYQTPKKILERLARTGTPLIDLVKRSQPKETEHSGRAAEVPSTSDIGSSPISFGDRTGGQREAAGTSSPLTSLLTPVHKKTWAGKAMKQEEEDDGVVTPGGTLRICGVDDFACTRTFCFKCGSAAAASTTAATAW